MTKPTPIIDASVAACFATFPRLERERLLRLRGLIFQVADDTAGVGRLEETLKWGQPAYLTAAPKSGTTIRLGLPKSGGVALYTHCQTTVISDFESLFPDDFTYEGNRAVHVSNDAPLPEQKLRLLIANALTYHLKAPVAPRR